MEDEEQQRFAKAVERKKQQAAVASHAPPRPGVETGPGTAEQEGRVDAGRPPDVRSPRVKSSGHGKKTADKWNQ